MMEDLFDVEYERFKRDVKQFIGVDLTQYKSAQMKRRIKSFITKPQIPTLTQFTPELGRNRELLALFKDFITINVTEFFRNEDKFEDLRVKMMPELIRIMKEQHRTTFKIWSAGCSTGAEAYTLAITMNEYFRGVPYSILATDIDTTVLAKAKLAEYKELEIRSVPKPLLEKYFDSMIEEEKWRLRPDVKQNVSFSINNLSQDPFQRGFDLILCRNVVIYFTEEAKDLLYKKFFDALVEGGVLFIGGTESILNAKQIGFKTSANLFYYK
ncbi:MAG: protein-glutamate O-methyltransferase CheR [Candidatus Margulisiibacteriota bacterium]